MGRCWAVLLHLFIRRLQKRAQHQKPLKQSRGADNFEFESVEPAGLIQQQNTATELNPIQNSSENVELAIINQEGIKQETDEEELQRLLKPNLDDLPSEPPSSVEFYFVIHYAPDFINEGHDQYVYVYRHANGLCVIGMALAHLAFKDVGGVIEVDFNVGKSDRSSMKVTGKRKRKDNVCGDRRYKRKMKNRESATRSRARRQAYTNELELELAHLRDENAMLRRRQEEMSSAAAAAVTVTQVPNKSTLVRSITAPF